MIAVHFYVVAIILWAIVIVANAFTPRERNAVTILRRRYGRLQSRELPYRYRDGRDPIAWAEFASCICADGEIELFGMPDSLCPAGLHNRRQRGDYAEETFERVTQHGIDADEIAYLVLLPGGIEFQAARDL